jgi:hypothetical protein
VSTRAGPAHPIGGRHGRWIGAALLVHFVVVCAVKISSGRGEEILWMSHVGLLMAGLGLVSRSVLMATTALTCVLVLHGLWLLDCLCWWTFGVFPLGATNYLVHADAWDWVATAHHFYLAPLLVVIVLRHRQWPDETLLGATAAYLFLSAISRAVTTPAANINYAFGVLTALDHPLVDLANRLPGSLYMLGLNAFVCALVFGPPALVGQRWARRIRSRQSTQSRHATALHPL